MATVIRLKRGGRTHDPYYRVVVMDSRQRVRGRVIEELGVYHPCARPVPVTEVNAERALHWLREGAQPSDTAKSLLSGLGIMKQFADGVPSATGENAEAAAAS
jgi:small subunit ribosomal protein S16